MKLLKPNETVEARETAGARYIVTRLHYNEARYVRLPKFVVTKRSNLNNKPLFK